MAKTRKKQETRTLKTVCKDCATDVMHWVHYAQAGDIPEYPPELNPKIPDWDINRKMFIHDGSISDLRCDVIVLSVTKTMSAKGMDLIYKEAGAELEKEAKKHAPKKVGDVVETDGYELPAEKVFHAVVPGAFESSKDLSELKSCYETCLEMVLSKGYKSIAFPCLGTGGNMINKDSAANVALGVIRTWMEEHNARVESVIFARFTDEDKEVYDKLLHRYFPTDKKKE